MSVFRFVIISDQKTKEITGAFMNILVDNRNELSKEIHYKKVGSFSGKIQYYGISGKYLNGWVYKNGKIEKTIKPGQLTTSNGLKTEIDVCSNVATPRYYTICAGDSGNCTTTFMGWDYSMVCEGFDPYGDAGGGGNSGGGFGDTGGGGTGAAVPRGYTADHGLVGKGVLPPNNTTDTQVGATCVFKTVEWISKFFGGNVTAGSAIEDYAKMYQLSGVEIFYLVTSAGVSSERLPAIVDMYFNTKTPISINSAIDAGHPLFATVTISPGNGHEVMITGYNTVGSIEYFDPQLGKYQTRNYGEFSNTIEVISKK